MRRTLTIVALTALVSVLGVSLGAFAIGSFGWYDVSARSGHPPLIASVVHWVMRQSVAHNAPDLPVPDLTNPMLVLRGATHYASGCAPCHGAPGQLASPIVKGMLPVPPGLYDVAQQFSPHELYWIVRDGIKMTAMPAWPATGRPDEIWAMVSFLEELPALKSADYAKLSGRTDSGEFLPQTSGPAFNRSTCARCHGDAGQGREQAFPNIAGLSADYIAAQLHAFRDGTRSSGFMQPIAAQLNDNAILDAARYFSGLPRRPAAPSAPPDLVAVGTKIYNEGLTGVPACASCHAAADGARNPEIPDISEQPASYTLTQLELFAAAIRAGTPPAKAMSRIASQLTQEQMQAVSAYADGVR